MKILVATEKPFAAVAVSGIKEIAAEAGHEVVLLEKYTDRTQLLEAVADVDALIVRSDKVTAEVIDAARSLKIVVRAGAGYDNLDLDACTRRGIVAMNTPGQNSNAVAELAIAMMIFMSRNQFTPGTGSELSGKKVGIQAYGNVGKLVARKAAALGMQVMAFDPFVDNTVMENDGVIPAATLEQMYSECNFISLHIPATPETVGSIGYDDIAAACQSELNEKFGKRVFATPKKMGAETMEANVNAGLAAARQICRFFATGCRDFQVNK